MKLPFIILLSLGTSYQKRNLHTLAEALSSCQLIPAYYLADKISIHILRLNITSRYCWNQVIRRLAGKRLWYVMAHHRTRHSRSIEEELWYHPLPFSLLTIFIALWFKFGGSSSIYFVKFSSRLPVKGSTNMYSINTYLNCVITPSEMRIAKHQLKLNLLDGFFLKPINFCQMWLSLQSSLASVTAKSFLVQRKSNISYY